jgi:hypothetical protein
MIMLQSVDMLVQRNLAPGMLGCGSGDLNRRQTPAATFTGFSRSLKPGHMIAANVEKNDADLHELRTIYLLVVSKKVI